MLSPQNSHRSGKPIYGAKKVNTLGYPKDKFEARPNVAQRGRYGVQAGAADQAALLRLAAQHQVTRADQQTVVVVVVADGTPSIDPLGGQPEVVIVSLLDCAADLAFPGDSRLLLVI